MSLVQSLPHASKGLAVISGASSGIGAATAQALSAAGHPLLLLARREEPMRALDLPRTMCRTVDVRDPAAWQRAIADAEAAYGPAEIVVNNAGAMLLGQVDTQDSAEWQRMFDVNVMGLLHGMQAVLGGMKARQRGTIVNISSVAGRHTFANHAVYCGTKFAVSAISEAVRAEVAADQVRVVAICPGVVDTALLSHTTSETIKADYNAWKEGMGAALAPADVAAAVVYACSQPAHVCVREIVLAPTRQEP